MNEFPEFGPKDEEKKLGESDQQGYPAVIGNNLPTDEQEATETEPIGEAEDEEVSGSVPGPGEIGYDPRPVSPSVITRSESEETDDHENE